MKKSWYVLLFLSVLHVKSDASNLSNLTAIAISSGLYQCNGSVANSALAAYVANSNLQSSVISSAVQNSVNCSDDATLSITGNITFGVDTVEIAVASLSDIVITGSYVINVPADGGVTINGNPYNNTVPGLTVSKTNSANTVSGNGSLFVTAAASGEYVTIGASANVNIAGSISFDGDSQGYVGVGGTITATGDIAMNNNSGVGGVAGVYVDGTITATGDIAMNNNSGVGGGAGVYVDGVGTITATGDIAMNNNSGDGGGAGGVVVGGGTTIKIDGTFTITVANSDDQKFDSSEDAITRTNETPLLFSAFVVTVGGAACPAYGDIPHSRVVLNVANQGS